MPRSLLPLPSLIRDMMTPRGMMRTPRSAFPSSTSLLDPLAGIAAWPEQMLQQMQQMPSILSLQEYQHTPKLDVAESKDRITIDAEMPGVRKEDVSLRIVDDPEHGVHNGSVLVLKGRTETKRDEGDIDALTKDMKETSGDTTVEKAITRPQYWFAERTVGEVRLSLLLT